ncbi:replicative DNA helicase [Nitratifractor sp.]
MNDERTLHNVNIERAVLSSILFDPETFEEVAARLKPEDFYLPFHQYLFRAMEQLAADEKPIDEEFLRQELQKHGRFDEEAMVAVLGANPISDTRAYIEEIKALSAKRSLVTLATEIRKLTVEEDLDATEVMDRVEQKLYEITQESITEDFRPSREIALSMMEEIERIKAMGNSRLIGVDTGFRNLNEQTSGFGKGDLVIVAARPAMGKTALTLNMALKAIERGEGVAFFSLEMPAEQLMLRILSAKTSIPLQSLRVGDLNDEQWAQLAQAVEEISRRKLFVDDGGYATIHHVRSKLRKLKTQHPEITLAIIDYLQLMSGEGGRDSRQQEISEISRGLKQLARELQIPIVALSQLNRSLESRENKRPILSDLRESGAIEQDADIILFVYRDDVYRLSEVREKLEKAKAEGQADKIEKYQKLYDEIRRKPEEETELIIGKQRNGPTGTVDLIFQKPFTRFVDAGGKKGFEVVYEEGNIDMREGNIEIPQI